MKVINICIVSLFLLSLTGCAGHNTVHPTPKKPSDNPCVNNFDVLRQMDGSAFSQYNKQFDKLRESYDFYEKNKKIMDKDPAELLSKELNSKLNLVCFRVRNGSYWAMEKKVNHINQL